MVGGKGGGPGETILKKGPGHRPPARSNRRTGLVRGRVAAIVNRMAEGETRSGGEHCPEEVSGAAAKKTIVPPENPTRKATTQRKPGEGRGDGGITGFTSKSIITDEVVKPDYASCKKSIRILLQGRKGKMQKDIRQPPAKGGALMDWRRAEKKVVRSARQVFLTNNMGKKQRPI